MSYRKLKADYLFDGFKMYGKEAVLICGQDGEVETIVSENEAGEGLEKFTGMLTPAFVNCHCHLELSHLKGIIAEKQGLVNFVLEVVNQRNQPDELKQEAILDAETEMLKTGIIAVGDICNTADTRVIKSAERLSYYNFIELLGWVPSQAESRYEGGKNLAGLFYESGQDENHLSIVPHAPYSVSDELWNLLKPGFAGKTVSIHNQESLAENEFFQSGTGALNRMYSRMKIDTSHFNAPGMDSLDYFLPKLKGASRILLVHNTYLRETGLIKSRFLNKNLFFCLCPNANLYIEDRLPDIPLFIKHEAPMVFGTDSLASNHQLSLLEEMKTVKKTFPSISTGRMLSWATSNGAKALAFDHKLGDFMKGKKPGVVLIENIADGEITGASISRRIL